MSVKNTSRSGRFLNQVIATIICNISSVGYGMAVGWISPALPQLSSPGGILSGVSKEDADEMGSWLGSLFTVGALFTAPFSSFLVHKFGEKKMALVMGIFMMINSITILAADDIEWLLFGRFALGIGACFSMATIPSYIGEMADPSIRGRLASIMTVSYTIGISLSYAVGGFVSYKAAGATMLGLSILGILLFCFCLPDTPLHLYKTGQISKAAKAISWFNRCEVNDVLVNEELEKLRKKSLENANSSLKTAAKLLLFEKYHRRGLGFCLCSVIIMSCTGMVAVHSYSVTIFTQSGAASLTPVSASLVYGGIQILGAVSAALVADHLGRKALFTCSCFGSAICLASMGGYFTVQSLGLSTEDIEWLPVVALSSCVYIYTLGLGCVPFVLLTELLSNEVRNLSVMIFSMVMFALLFMTLRFFSPVVNLFGPHILFFCLGSWAFLGGVWGLIWLPETKGKSAEDIRALLSK